MPPYQVPKARVDSIVEQVIKALKASDGFEVLKEPEARAAIRNAILQSFRAEHELEQEVLETLRAHGQAIDREGADFSKLLQDGKKILARKKGIVL